MLVGVYAQIVPCQLEGEQVWRHLHPCEVAILTGVPPTQDWSPHQRLNLCALGQQASPLQSVWVAAHALAHVQKVFKCEVITSPVDCLHALKRKLFAEAAMLYPNVRAEVTPVLEVSIFSAFDGQSMTIRCPQGTKVAQLLQAESRLCGDGSVFVVMAMANQVPLSGEAVLDGSPLCVCPAWSQVAHAPIVHVPLHDEPEYDIPVTATALDVDLEELGDELIEPLLDAACEAVHNTQGQNETALLQILRLPTEQIKQIVPPFVIDPTCCTHFCQQLVESDVRLSMLVQQEDLWADDEMTWHLSQIAQGCDDPQIMFLDPLLLRGLAMVSLTAQTLTLPDHVTRVVSAVCLCGPWTPCIWVKRDRLLTVYLWEHDGFELDQLNSLHAVMCTAMNASNFSISCQRRSFGYGLCGAASISFFRAFLLQHDLPRNDSELLQTHLVDKNQFVDFVKQETHVPRPWMWGAGKTDADTMLMALLQLHGVPSAVSASRAKLIVQSLGKDRVQQAVFGPSPWKSLKAAANQLSPPFQLVLPEELNVKTAQPKTKESKKKGKKEFSTGPWSLPTEVDPAKVVLEPGTFRVGNDEEVPQVRMAHFGPLAVGVALATLPEAKQFLQSGKVLTSKGLALLLLNVPGDVVTPLPWQTIRFAAKCSVNQEPILLAGVLVQFGQQPIYLYTDKSNPSVPEMEVSCCRATVFRDQLEMNWEEFSRHPVKCILNAIPGLTTCRAEACVCPSWHPSGPGMPDVILDVFRRQFFSETGKPTSSEKAAHYGVMFRFQKCQEDAVLRMSGRGGIYLEPRNEAGTGVSLDYQVIWLAQSSYEEVAHKAQLEVRSLGIARHGQRYGIRVAALHFQSAFTALKPDALYLEPGPRSIWQVGPWPYGVDRKGLAAILRKWSWQARPLQPDRAVPGGLMWKVQAVADPPQTVYCMKHGQVVVSKCEAIEVQEPLRPTVTGPNTTVKLCMADPSVDPLQLADPWLVGQAKLPSQTAPVAMQVDSKSQLAEMEARLEQAILAKIPAPAAQDMETDEQDQRIAHLEEKIHQLANRQQHLEVVVQDHQVQNANQLQTMQSQMMSQLDMQGKQMKSLFDQQMERMAKILGKKDRFE